MEALPDAGRGGEWRTPRLCRTYGASPFFRITPSPYGLGYLLPRLRR